MRENSQIHSSYSLIRRYRIQWKNVHTFPVNRQSFQVLDLCWAATEACHLIQWNLSGTQRNAFGNPRSMFDSSQTPYQGILHSTNPSATRCNPSAGTYRDDLSREVKNELGARHQCRWLQEGRQLWILSYQRKFHRIRWLYSKGYRYRSFSSINSPHLHRFHVGR